MSGLVARLRAELVDARKAQDKPRTLLLSTILADVKNRSLDLGRDVTDEEGMEVLRRGIRQRRDAASQFQRAGRSDLEERERTEAQSLESFLPPAMDDDGIRAVVRGAMDAGATTLGAIMGRAMQELRGKADGARVQAIAREELAQRG